MKKNFITETPFQRAYSRWFSDYERERKHQKKRAGSKLVDFAPPPTHPEDVRLIVERIGRHQVQKILGIHRTTLSRWISGEAVIPRPAWLLLVLMADGRLPGMSEDWSGFRFDADRLHIIGTRHSYSALEIAGWHYQQAHAEALSRRVVELEKKTAYLLQTGRFDAANDALMAI